MTTLPEGNSEVLTTSIVLPDAGYISYCNAAGTGGVMAMCTDGACGVCGAANMPFTNGACLTVPAGVTPVGAFPRVAVNCSALAGSELQVPLEGTSVFVTYHADPDCMVGPANYRTEFLTQSGRCNPVSATASVSFDCVGDTGVYKQYTTAGDCTGASLDTPFFASGQCLPQPEGEPALSVMCAQPPSPSPTPSPTPSQTPSGAARSPSASPTASASSIAVVDAQSGSGGLEAGVASVIAAVVGTVAMMAGAWMV